MELILYCKSVDSVDLSRNKIPIKVFMFRARRSGKSAVIALAIARPFSQAAVETGKLRRKNYIGTGLVGRFAVGVEGDSLCVRGLGELFGDDGDVRALL